VGPQKKKKKTEEIREIEQLYVLLLLLLLGLRDCLFNRLERERVSLPLKYIELDSRREFTWGVSYTVEQKKKKGKRTERRYRWEVEERVV